MPPAKILIAASLDELEILAVRNQRAIDQEVLQEHLVLWLLIIESELEPPHPCLRFAGISAGAVAKFEQSAFNLCHASDCFNRGRRRRDGRVELIAKQMLDVVNQQLLMLHFVLESETPDRQNCFRIIAGRNLFEKSRHLFVNMLPVSASFAHSWPRTRAALGSLNPRAKSFVIRIEVEKKLFGVDLVIRLILLQHGFKEPGGVADVPARRAHELGGLNDIVFDL